MIRGVNEELESKCCSEAPLSYFHCLSSFVSLLLSSPFNSSLHFPLLLQLLFSFASAQLDVPTYLSLLSITGVLAPLLEETGELLGGKAIVHVFSWSIQLLARHPHTLLFPAAPPLQKASLINAYADILRCAHVPGHLLTHTLGPSAYDLSTPRAFLLPLVFQTYDTCTWTCAQQLPYFMLLFQIPEKNDWLVRTEKRCSK
eukprot:1156277-Pelagomonas_calceolata.AAC.5